MNIYLIMIAQCTQIFWKNYVIIQKEDFLAKINKNLANILEDTSNILFYISSQDILDYYKYTSINFSDKNLEPSVIKIYY